ncbi:746_t:CDS:2 [Gigaspora rosea]|nr:746_t:CDS:2 [Gigaspora rosea]
MNQRNPQRTTGNPWWTLLISSDSLDSLNSPGVNSFDSSGSNSLDSFDSPSLVILWTILLDSFDSPSGRFFQFSQWWTLSILPVILLEFYNSPAFDELVCSLLWDVTWCDLNIGGSLWTLLIFLEESKESTKNHQFQRVTQFKFKMGDPVILGLFRLLAVVSFDSPSDYFGLLIFSVDSFDSPGGLF